LFLNEVFIHKQSFIRVQLLYSNETLLNAVTRSGGSSEQHWLMVVGRVIDFKSETCLPRQLKMMFRSWLEHLALYRDVNLVGLLMSSFFWN